MTESRSAPNARRASRLWSVIRPIHAKVGARNIVSRTRPGFGPPEAWFDASVLAAAGLYAVGFDFFINWRTHKLETPFWLKRSAVGDPGGVSNFDLAAVTRALAADPANFLEGARLYGFAAAHGYDPAWTIIPEWFHWTDGRGSILLCDIGVAGQPTAVEVVSLADLQVLIHRHTGQYFKLQKGLYWSYTTLEGFLSTTGTPWPGDADIVLVSNNTHEAKADLFRVSKSNARALIETLPARNLFPARAGKSSQFAEVLKPTNPRQTCSSTSVESRSARSRSSSSRQLPHRPLWLLH